MCLFNIYLFIAVIMCSLFSFHVYECCYKFRKKKYSKLERVSWLNVVEESDVWRKINRSQGRPRRTWSRNRHCLCHDVKMITKMNKRKKKVEIDLLEQCPA